MSTQSNAELSLIEKEFEKIFPPGFFDLLKQNLGASNNVQEYWALLTQEGTDAPTAIVLRNTLGEDIEWFYDNIGNYHGSKLTPFIYEKTGLLIQSTGWASSVQSTNIDLFEGDLSNIYIEVRNSSTTAALNGGLKNTFVQIIVSN